jgi:hypothetical protein
MTMRARGYARARESSGKRESNEEDERVPMFRRSRKHGDGQGDQETASERVNEVGLTDEQGDDAGDWRCRCSDAAEA